MFNLIAQWFFVSTKCQADQCFIHGHSFGLPQTYLNIIYIEYSLDRFMSLDQNSRHPHILS